MNHPQGYHSLKLDQVQRSYHLCWQVMVHDVKRMMSTLENADSSVEFQVSHIALHHREV